MTQTATNISEFVAEIDRQKLVEAASALNIPEENHDKAVIKFRQAIIACLTRHWQIQEFPSLMKNDRRALKQIAEAAHELSLRLSKRSEAVERYLDVQWTLAPNVKGEPVAEANTFIAALDVLQKVDLINSPDNDEPWVRYPNHRKDGPVPKHEVLRLLVGWLEGMASELGGAASTKERADGKPGRLVETLNLLRPFFPVGVIPLKLSAKTLEKWKADNVSLRKGLEALNNP